MYAVIETGGKQYLVEEGTVLRIEKLGLESGGTVNFENVLLIGGDGAPRVGTPLVDGAEVQGTVLDQGRDRKVVVYHKKRRKGYEKRYGHRQPYTQIKVTKISA